MEKGLKFKIQIEIRPCCIAQRPTGFPGWCCGAHQRCRAHGPPDPQGTARAPEPRTALPLPSAAPCTQQLSSSASRTVTDGVSPPLSWAVCWGASPLGVLLAIRMSFCNWFLASFPINTATMQYVSLHCTDKVSFRTKEI